MILRIKCELFMSKIISVFLLFLLSPVLLFIAFLIIIDDGFPIFFKQKRVGKDNEFFPIFKFRTMKKNTPNIATHLMKSSDNYLTKTGPFLRKFSLDEIPQLYNILRGELNFIGPRPALYNQTDLISLRTKKNIHLIRPGITGWAQVNGRDENTIKKKVDLDEYYLNNKSLFLNIKIIFLSLIKVLNASNVRT